MSNGGQRRGRRSRIGKRPLVAFGVSRLRSINRTDSVPDFGALTIFNPVFRAVAVFRDRTAVAFRANRIATGLTERDEMTVPGLPVFDGQDLPEGHFGLDGF